MTRGTCDMFTSADDTLKPSVHAKVSDVVALDHVGIFGLTSDSM